jgi:LysM repeat protein
MRFISLVCGAVAKGRADVRETAERRSLRNKKILVQCQGNLPLCIYASLMSGAPKAARTRASQHTVQAAFPVSASFTGRGPLGSQASSASTPIKRILPFAAAPAAVAGLAAAFALGNAPSAPVAAEASGHHSAPPATPRADVSAVQAMSITQQPATGLPVVRLDASRLAAIKPKGKHHRTLPASYVVKSGDTLASIAQQLYRSSDYWTALYWANHSKIKYANEIQAGQVLAVPAKPAKIPSAPKALAAAPAPATSTSSYGGSYSSASTAESSASTAAAAPVQTGSTSTGSAGSFQACVIAAESGGNSQVMNSSGHYGLYQFSASTWAAYGGNPADFGNASVAEQNQVFNNAIAAGGESNWAPYDGC